MDRVPRSAWRRNTRNLIAATLLLFAIFAVIPIPQAAASGGSETFEDDATLADPIDSDYTYAKVNANAFVQSTTAYAGTKAYRYVATSIAAGGDYAYFTYPNARACTASGGPQLTSGYSFQFRVSALPDAGDVDYVFLQNSGGVYGSGTVAGIQLDSAGVVRGYGLTGGAIAAYSIGGPVMAPNTWYDFTFFAYCTNSGGGAGQYSCVQSNALLVSVCTAPGTATIGSGTRNTLMITSGDTGTLDRQLFLDNIQVTGISPYPTVPVTRSASFTGIVGGDMSQNGLFHIIRTNSGSNIAILDGATLASVYTENTNCNFDHGIVAIEDTGVGFLKCSAGNDVTSIKFTDQYGQTVADGRNQVFRTCADTICDGTFSLAGINAGNDEDSFRFLTVSSPPYEQDLVYSAGNKHSVVRGIELGIGGGGTNVGAYGLRLDYQCGSLPTSTDFGATCGSSPTQEKSYFKKLSYGVNPVDGACNTGNGLTYMVDQAQSLKGFYLSSQVEAAHSPLNAQYPIGDITWSNFYTGPSSVANANGIACANSHVVVSHGTSSSKVQVLKPLDNGVVETPAITSGVQNGGVAYAQRDQDVSFAAYAGTSFIDIFNTTTGVPVASVAVPSGTFQGMDMDQFAQGLVVYMSTGVYYYDIHAYTTVSSEGSGCVNDCPIPSGTGTSSSTSTSGTHTNSQGQTCVGQLCGPAQASGNPLGNAVAYFNDSWGFDGSILFGIAIVVMVGFGFAAISRSPVVIGIGLFLGVVVAFILGLMSLWILFVVIFLVIALAGSVMFNRESDESGG